LSSSLFFRPLARQFQKRFKGIFVLYPVPVRLATPEATLYNGFSAIYLVIGDRLHQPATFLQPIARKNIDVLAIQTAGAVIRIAIPLGQKSTVLAREVFDSFLKYFPRIHTISSVDIF
jgi:hypothetical protein